ncbi:glycosyltransferase [Desulfovibrio sp. OttesenSCG-928-C06]|nr:glycosyltransferase [Desulfovibrio sp. OttesenSCG-928-C06]
MNQPLITIITATFNAAKPLPRLIDSLAAQSFRNFEWVVQDALSTDGTLQLLDNAALTGSGGHGNPCHPGSSDCFEAPDTPGVPSIAVQSEPDSGIYDAWNKGVQRARGQWIIFLGADDFLLHERALEQIVETLVQAKPEIDFVATPVVLATERGYALETLVLPPPRAADLHKGMPLMPPGLFIRCSVLQANPFAPSFKIAGDYDFICRTLTDSNVCMAQPPCTGMEIGGVSAKPDNLVRTFKESLLALTRNHPGQSRLQFKKRILFARSYSLFCRIFGRRTALRFVDMYRIFVRRKAPMWSMNDADWPESRRFPRYGIKQQENTPLFSLVIATCGRVAELERLLESLCMQTMSDFEVLIADQNQPGVLDELVGKYNGRLALTRIQMPEPGVSKARNAGFAQARGKYTAYPDDDCVYGPRTLETAASLFGRLPHAGAMLADWCPLAELVHAHEANPALYNRPIPRTSVFRNAETWRMFYRREAIESVGGFDPQVGPGKNITYAAAEDSDLLMRVLLAGYMAVRPSELRIFHPPVDLSNPGLARKNRVYCLARMHLLAKYRMPLWFRLANIAYPLLRLPLEGPRALRYRMGMFWWRLRYLFKRP